MPKPSTKTHRIYSDGTSLENEVATVLRLMPGANVSNQVEIGGKKVDAYCVLPNAFFPSFRIAVECKDWSAPLTRKDAAGIISEYHPLLDADHIDQFLLITRNGIVPSARKIFDARRFHHLTFAELADKIFDPGPLVDNMRRQFSADGLSEYYIPQYGFAPNLDTIQRDYSRFYNEFLDFAIELRQPYYYRAVAEWEASGGDSELAESYTPAEFDRCYAARLPEIPQPLSAFVFDWLERDDISFGLAILGSYGTGKSSFARHLAHSCAEAYLKGRSRRIPFLIELKEFGSHQDIRGLITHELVNRHGVANGSFELFRSLNAAGRFVLILDGFDEMKQGMTSDSLLFNFNQIASLHGGRAKVILGGRPTLFESQQEQNKILKGDLSLGGVQSAKYVQVTVAPFDSDDVCSFLLRYSEVKDAPNSPKVRRFVEKLRDDIERDGQLAELVSRPVHLPMLVSVIPRTKLEPRDVRRAVLYDEFINAIIDREMLKRPIEFQRLYGTKARRRFAREIAVEMCRKGESRSIRSSEIPDSLIADFVAPGFPKDAVRRDLVSACFLERKPPDILFIPHKSFLEFLAAEHVSYVAKRGDVPQLDVGFAITPEIFSFAVELLSEEDWILLLRHPSANDVLLTMWTANVRDTQGEFSPAVEAALYEHFAELSNRVLTRIIEHYQGSRKAVSALSIQLLRKCLGRDSSVVSVNAYRALRQRRVQWVLSDLLVTIGEDGIREWIRAGWIESGVDEELVRAKLIHVLRRLSGPAQL